VAGAQIAALSSSAALQWTCVAFLVGLDILLIVRTARKPRRPPGTAQQKPVEWACWLLAVSPGSPLEGLCYDIFAAPRSMACLTCAWRSQWAEKLPGSPARRAATLGL